MEVRAIDHVQLAMPAGGESAAREFYGGVLGLSEVAKPSALAARGGVWFSNGHVVLHLGVEAEFRPARKAHAALLVDDLDAFDAACRFAGLNPQHDGDLPGYRRFYVRDPFGNRLELVQALEPRRTE